MLIKVLQGVAIGVAIILPGLSGGTAIVILGFYSDFLRHLSRLSLRPYLPVILGAAAGILLGIFAIGFLIDHYPDVTAAFLLGMLVASLRIVIAHAGIRRIEILPLLAAAIGFSVTWFFVFRPAGGAHLFPPGSLLTYFIGGAVSSATMLLPGVSGSSILVAFGIYDDIILAVQNIHWPVLLVLAAGFAVGLFGFARLLLLLYRRYPDLVSMLLLGLIVGSTRALIPQQINLVTLVAGLTGVFLVLYLSKYALTNKT